LTKKQSQALGGLKQAPMDGPQMRLGFAGFKKSLFQLQTAILGGVSVTGVGSIIFNWLSCINEYHKLKEGNKR
jgi:hypothetical protein